MDLASLCPYTLLVTIPTIMLGYFWFSAFLFLLDDFKLFSAVFLKGFNFSFPAVIRIQSVAFRPTHFWPFQDNLFLYKRFHCS